MALRIDRLALRVAGLSRSEAQSLALDMADQLARAPLQGSARRIETLRVTVRLAHDAEPGRLAGRIADALLLQLAREGG